MGSHPPMIPILKYEKFSSNQSDRIISGVTRVWLIRWRGGRPGGGLLRVVRLLGVVLARVGRGVGARVAGVLRPHLRIPRTVRRGRRGSVRSRPRVVMRCSSRMLLSGVVPSFRVVGVVGSFGVVGGVLGGAVRVAGLVALRVPVRVVVVRPLGRRCRRGGGSRRSWSLHRSVVRYLTPYTPFFGSIHLLDAVAVVLGQHEVALDALVPGVHERTLHRAVAEPQRVPELVRRHRQQGGSFLVIIIGLQQPQLVVVEVRVAAAA